MKLLIKIFFQTTCIILLASSGIFLYTTYCGKIRVYRISTVMKAVYSEQISYSLKIKQAFLTIRNRMPTTKCAPK